MTADLDIDGVYVPAFFGLMLIAYLICQGLQALFARAGLYAFVWHRALFNLGLYVIVLGAAYAAMRSVA
ncbi:MAG TPA: DUF1656 domain-containing protein [Roseomonas sp.]|jgi:hypothetical protein